MRETRDRTGGSARLYAVGLVPLALLAAGCGNRQDVLAPHSHQERAISQLWWWMLGGSCVGFGAIAFLLLLGWLRRRDEGLPGGGGDRAATALVVGLGIAVPIVVLTALFVWSDIFVLKTTAAPNPRSTPLTIHVIGRQWFWEVRYPGTGAVTANEIHIPVRTRVNVVATTGDVIHSFWVPSLNRKIDMIPGRRNRVLLDADQVGVYRGQCAEFCGLQHANMAMSVVAEPRAAFDRWLANMAKPARTPGTDAQRRGEETFLGECASCHQIRGTNAESPVGPDLTHLATRSTLAALTIPNTPSQLRAWIRDPQHVKPGNRMPAVALSSSQLDELVAYLESLR